MENSAYVAMVTKTQINTLTKTNSKLAEQLKKAVETIAKLTEDNSKLLSIIEKVYSMSPPCRALQNQPCSTPLTQVSRKIESK
eukprot:9715155-Ditylum_brightwellii.AAC.1